MSKNRAEDEAAIQAVLDASYKAWEEGDADGMVADYLPDATAIMPGALRGDREVIRESMTQGFASFLKGSTTVNEQLGIRFLSEDTAIVLSRAAILFGGQTEVPGDEAKVNCTWVFQKQDGAWKIAAYHNSPVLMPAQ